VKWQRLKPWRDLTAQLIAIAAAFALEAAAGWIFWYSADQLPRLALAVLVHSLACLVVASAFAALLPPLQRDKGRGAALFVWLLCFFVPGIGMIGLLVGVLPALWWPAAASAEVSPRAWSYLGIPPLPDHSPKPRELGAMHYGVASISAILQGASDLGQRQRGVLATLRLRDNESIPLLRRALRDPEDDIRLLAYALLDRKEEAITTRMRHHQRRLEETEGVQAVGHHSAIAHDCWELIHLGLVEGEVTTYLLTTARHHAEQALALNPQNPGLRLLLGKVLGRMGERGLASDNLRQAEELGIDGRVVSSFLAEFGVSPHETSEAQNSAASQANRVSQLHWPSSSERRDGVQPG
jgi:hypothetical protein